MMDCQHARLLLEFDRPGARGQEFESSEAAALEEHLHDCPSCARAADWERRVHETIGRAMRDVPIPAGLRERLLVRLSAERDARSRRWLVRGVAAAAAIILAVWLGQIWWSNQLPAIDWETVADSQQPRTPSRIEDWYRLRNISMAAPPDLNYQMLNSYGISLFQGVPVPHLIFVAPSQGNQPPAVAHVYVLSDREFDLRDIRETIKKHYFRHTTVVEKHPEHPHLVYLIVCTTESPEPFRAPRPVN